MIIQPFQDPTCNFARFQANLKSQVGSERGNKHGYSIGRKADKDQVSRQAQLTTYTHTHYIGRKPTNYQGM